MGVRAGTFLELPGSRVGWLGPVAANSLEAGVSPPALDPTCLR
jgi:hypothetical protein